MNNKKVILSLFDKSSATFLGDLFFLIEGGNEFMEVPDGGEVVELCEPNVQIEPAFFVNSGEEASIGIPGLLEIGDGVLPVDISGEPLSHGLDEIDL